MLKIKTQTLKVNSSSLFQSYDSYSFAISVCPSRELKIQRIVITICKFLMSKTYSCLHKTEATRINGFVIKQKLPPLNIMHVEFENRTEDCVTFTYSNS